MSSVRLLVLAPVLGACASYQAPLPPGLEFGVPAIDRNPRAYVCYRAPSSPNVDGDLSDPAWSAAPWTEAFVDIAGPAAGVPRFATRAKMLWDDDHLYLAAELEEPHVWGAVTERDAVVYHDNDFEVFLDPDGDGHDYFELELNALGTVWDLLITKPYRAGGHGVDAWDIAGLRSAVRVDGTVNRSDDTDRGWSVEIAIPWRVLGETTWKAAPPRAGDQWRVNLARVEWRHRTARDGYARVLDPETGKPLAPDNWVWSPQGLIDMHYPEMWGFVQFSERQAGTGEEAFVPDPANAASWAAYRLYYAQQRFRETNDRYTRDARELDVDAGQFGGIVWPPRLFVSPHGFEAYVVGTNGASVRIDESGRLQVMRRP